jgi:hypothetical protein
MESKLIRTHQELEVYRSAFELAISLSPHFPTY